MFRKSLVAVGLLGLTLLAAPPQQPKSGPPPAARTLKLKLAYTGAGKVDQNHKLFVFLFDSPDFVQGSGMPIASRSATAKTETVTFTDISISPVYLVAVYDPTGGYDGTSGPPPSGSSTGLYGKNPGQPDPVKIDPGKTVQISLAFDDSVKMP